MDYRSFEGFDAPTTHNLWVLEQCSQKEPYGDEEAMQQMLMHVIGTHELLPKPVRILIPISRCYTGDRHFHMTTERQHQLWREINDDLRAGLDRVLTELSGLVLDRTSLLDRPETLGERILDLCAKLKHTGWDIDLAKQLQRAGTGSEVEGDARKLETLFGRMNIPDSDVHEREISGLIDRIKTIAQRLHHRRVLA